jgi:hypothetical protein
MPKQSDEQYTEEEADRRFREAIRHAVTTPHKPRSAKQKSKVVVKDRKKKA